MKPTVLSWLGAARRPTPSKDMQDASIMRNAFHPQRGLVDSHSYRMPHGAFCCIIARLIETYANTHTFPKEYHGRDPKHL